jgi:hypothetical protein
MGDDDVSMRLPETQWMEARDGIEPPSMGLQSPPFSFRVPRHLSQQLIASRVEKMRAPILRVPSHKVPPPKESMKEFLENRGLNRAAWLQRVTL